MNRQLVAGLLTAVLGVAVLPGTAQAAWRGLRSFNCETTTGNWNFDGLYGPYTTAAVRRFQTARGIKVDGIAGPETYKALGLAYHRTLRCGMGGNEVFEMQQALASAGFWYGAGGATRTPVARPTVKPKPRPTMRPVSRPSAGWTAPPVIYTPQPAATPAPMASEEPPTLETPQPAMTAAPAEESRVIENRPTFELSGGDWMAPRNAGSTNYDYAFARPTWVGDASLWFGDVGIGGGATVFNETWVTYRPAAYFQLNTMMIDADLKYRFDHGFYQVFAGYRGIGQANVNFGTLGVAMNRPLAGDWLWLEAKLQGGHNFSDAYFVDGQAGLGLRFDPIGLDVGFRQLAFQNGAEPLFSLNGPTVGLRLAF